MTSSKMKFVPCDYESAADAQKFTHKDNEQLLLDLELQQPNNVQEVQEMIRQQERLEYDVVKRSPIRRKPDQAFANGKMRDPNADYQRQFMDRLKKQKTRNQLYLAFHKQLDQLDQLQWKTVHLAKDVVVSSHEASQSRIVPTDASQNVESKIRRLQHAMHTLTSNQEQLDVVVETYRSWLPSSSHSPRDVAFMNSLLQQRTHSIQQVSIHVQEAIQILKNDKETFLMRDQVSLRMVHLQQYLNDCVAAYANFGVGITSRETRRYLEVLAKAKVETKTLLDEGRMLVRKFCDVHTKAADIHDAKQLENALLDLHEDLGRIMEEVNYRLQCAFTVFSTLDELLFETEELLIHVTSSDTSPSCSQPPTHQEEHLIAKSNHIWKEFMKVEKLSFQLLDSMKKELLPVGEAKTAIHWKSLTTAAAPRPANGRNLQKGKSMVQTTELVLKMKLFTLWYKLQELLKLSGQNPALFESTDGPSIHLTSKSMDNEEIMQKNLRTHLKETTEEIVRSKQKCLNINECDDPSVLQKSLQLLESIRKELKDTLDTFHQELKAMGRKTDRSSVILESSETVEREYNKFMRQWQDKYNKLFNKSIASRTLNELATRLEMMDAAVEQLLREFTIFTSTSLSLKSIRSFQTSCSALLTQLMEVKDDLDKCADAPYLVENSDTKDRFTKLNRQQSSCSGRLHLFAKILSLLEKFQQFNDESAGLCEVVDKWLYNSSSQSSSFEATATKSTSSLDKIDHQLHRLLQTNLQPLSTVLKDKCHQLWGLLQPAVQGTLEEWRQCCDKLTYLRTVVEAYPDSRSSEGKPSPVSKSSKSSSTRERGFTPIPLTHEGSSSEQLLQQPNPVRKPSAMRVQELELSANQKLTLQHVSQLHPTQLRHSQCQWYKSNWPIRDVNQNKYAIGKVDVRTFQLEKECAELNDTGCYSLDIMDSTGQCALEQALFKVTIRQAPQFEEVPARQLVLSVNARLELHYRLSGSPQPHVTWLLNDSPLKANTPDMVMIQSAADCYKLVIGNVSLNDTGTYTCVAVNDLGVKECSTKLEVKGNLTPHILRPLQKTLQVASGQKVTLDVPFQPDNSNLEVVWYFNHEVIYNQPNVRIVVFQNHSTLVISKVNKFQHEGHYRMEVKNSCGTSASDTTLLVHPDLHQQLQVSVQKEVDSSTPISGVSAKHSTVERPTVDLESTGKSYNQRDGDVLSDNVQFYWMLEEFDYVQEELCWMTEQSVEDEVTFTISIAQPSYVLWYVNGILVCDGMHPMPLPESNMRVTYTPDATSFSLAVSHVSKERHHGNCYSVITMKAGREVLTNFLLLVNEANVLQGNTDELRLCEPIIFEKRTPAVNREEMEAQVKSAELASLEPHENEKYRAPEFPSIFEDIVTDIGQAVVFKCILHATPKCDIWWTFNGQSLPSHCHTSRHSVGPWMEELLMEIDSVNEKDSGRYCVTAENYVGLAGCSALLIVNQKHSYLSRITIPLKHIPEPFNASAGHKDARETKQSFHSYENAPENESFTTAPAACDQCADSVKTTTTTSSVREHRVWTSYRKRSRKRTVLDGSDA